MATWGPPSVPMGDAEAEGLRASKRPWRMASALSRLADRAEHALGAAGLDRGPWLVVALGTGIAGWFAMPKVWHWIAAIAAAVVVAIAAEARWRGNDGRAAVRQGSISLAIAFALGMGLIWARSEIAGTPAIEAPRYGPVVGRILEREDQPGEDRVRFVLAMRDAVEGRAIRVRLNLTPEQASAQFAEGAVVAVTARLMPPAPPLVPGAYNFARRAWFDGLAATGTALGPVRLIAAAPETSAPLKTAQRRLSQHVRARIDGAPGSIAATLASGDRGAIAPADDAALRDAGLAHLLSISGVHVSALMIAAYAAAFRLLALWPWLVLRWRIPVLAGFISALAGIGYTLLTGAEVPTVRSCFGALLVLAALVLGREPLSLRLVAVAAALVLFLWPEALVGPSFQMSFAAVLAIVALHQAAPVRRFLAPREEPAWQRLARRGAMLFATGVVIELALMPIVLFHFHRAGLYGALANVVAIPLVSFVTMPMLALALLLDGVGLGAPAWWLTDLSLEALLAIAHRIADAPYAVRLVPAGEPWMFAVFAAGGLWLALWQGRIRAWGLTLSVPAMILMSSAAPPDLMVPRDGRELAVMMSDKAGQDRLLLLRDGAPDSYTRETLAELTGQSAPITTLPQWPGARCSADFCALTVQRGGRDWHVLVARSNTPIEERALASACAMSDIVIAGRWLPRSCMPRWLKADRALLAKSGGLAIDFETQRLRTVADGEGEHGWFVHEESRRSARPGPISRDTAPQPIRSESRSVAARSSVVAPQQAR